MKITLKDGSVREYSEPMTVNDIAFDISGGLGRAACAGEIDGEVVDLRTTIDKDCNLNILTFKDEAGKAAYRHTTSHVLAEAIKNLYPDVKLAIGPSVDNGFYYDFDSEPFSREDLDKIEAEMKKIIKKGAKLERFTLPREDAIKYMEDRNEPYKVELIKDLPEDSIISFYSQGEFVDLCAGPHLMSTKSIKAFKLTSSSMAYWRGDSNKARLQRIYGTAFNTKEELAEYLLETNGNDGYYQHNTFWPTTPDILTAYVRDNGVAGHCVRAVLAAMGSPSWGIYNGYELIENKQRPGFEEQIDNEKYEVKVRDWSKAKQYGVAEMLTALNKIRRAHPAALSYHNLTVLPTSDPNILAFARHTPAELTGTGQADTLIVVVNLDGHNAHQSMIHLELSELGLPTDRPLNVRDELTGREFQWGWDNYVSLAPWADVAHILSVQ